MDCQSHNWHFRVQLIDLWELTFEKAATAKEKDKGMLKSGF